MAPRTDPLERDLGVALAEAPRALLAAHVSEAHEGRIGTYVTTGIDERSGRPYAYVGSGLIDERLCEHLRDSE